MRRRALASGMRISSSSAHLRLGGRPGGGESDGGAAEGGGAPADTVTDDDVEGGGDPTRRGSDANWQRDEYVTERNARLCTPTRTRSVFRVSHLCMRTHSDTAI